MPRDGSYAPAMVRRKAEGRVRVKDSDNVCKVAFSRDTSIVQGFAPPSPARPPPARFPLPALCWFGVPAPFCRKSGKLCVFGRPSCENAGQTSLFAGNIGEQGGNARKCDRKAAETKGNRKGHARDRKENKGSAGGMRTRTPIGTTGDVGK